MSLSSAIAKNTAIQSFGKFFGLALSLMSAGIIFPYLGEVGVGKYTAILSLLQIFGTMMDFGLYIILIQRMSTLTEKSTREVSAIFTLRLFSGIFFLSLAPLTAWILGWYSDFYSQEIILATAITALFYLAISFNQLLSAVFQKFFHTGWIALAELIGKSMLFLLSLLAVFLGWNLLWVMSTLVVSSVLQSVILFIASRKYIRVRYTIDLKIWKQIIQEAWPIGVSIAFALIYFKGDTVLLTFYESPQIIGEYGAPYKILEVLITFPAIFVGLILPPLTAAWKEKKVAAFENIMQHSFHLLAAIAIPMIFATQLLAPYIMALLVPEGFFASDDMLRILIIATGSIFIGTLFGYAVPALGKQRSMMWCYICIALLSLAAYLFMIPRYSITGAAWVTVFSELAVLFCSAFIVVRTTKIRIRYGIVWKIILAALVMFFGLHTLLDPVKELLLEYTFSNRLFSIMLLSIMVPIGCLLYASILFITGAFTKKDIENIFPQKK